MLSFCLSCQKEVTSTDGKSINFAVATGSVSATKAVYSGDRTATSERIDWEDGDKVCIFTETSDPQSADYKVSGTITSDGASSTATLSACGERLKWFGDDDSEKVFYGVYPSPTVKSGDELANGSMKGTVSGLQKPRSVSDAAPYLAVADLKDEYMLCKKSTKYTENIKLEFTPMTTAIEFTIKNAVEPTLLISQISLISTSHEISGAFTADLAGWTGKYPVCSAFGTGGKTVIADFTGTVVETTGLAKNETLTFTLFLRPTDDVDDLTFKLTKPDGSWLSTKLATSTKEFITFPQYKKSYVTGLLIPEGAQWTVKYDPTVQSWDTDTDGISPMPETEGDPFVTSWDTGIVDELTITDPYNGHEYVEIGGIKWATCNVGANNPKDYGWYFFWAGTTGYKRNGSKWVTEQDGSELLGGFSWANTPFHDGIVKDHDWYKYISSGKETYCISGGSPDNIDTLEIDDDAATANWGGAWRMPTQKEFQDLYEACGGTGSPKKPNPLPSANPPQGIYWVEADQIYITDYTGAAGILFCDGENMLFFVAAGYGQEAAYNGADSEGRYWFSSLYLNQPHLAYRLGFRKNDIVNVENASERREGLPVRPVSD